MAAHCSMQYSYYNKPMHDHAFLKHQLYSCKFNIANQYLIIFGYISNYLLFNFPIYKLGALPF